VLGTTSSQRINTMVTDAVTRTLEGDLTEVRMSDEILQATLALRSFLFEAVYENPRATAEFEKASGILGGLWDKLKARPEPYLDRTTMDTEGLEAAVTDFLAGMTDRYAVALFEEFFVPRSWHV
jgi:dGTPase